MYKFNEGALIQELQQYIDATYEGDLMASAGVSYHIGRESTKTYDEKWNGVQTQRNTIQELNFSGRKRFVNLIVSDT